MAESLTPLDATFLELEQVDAGAHMHIGGVMIFDPLPGGGAPPVETIRAHLSSRLGTLPRFRQRLSEPQVGGLSWPSWIEDAEPRLEEHVTRVDPARRPAARRAARLGGGVLLGPARPLAPALGDGARRRARGRALGAGHQDAPRDGRRGRLGRRRLRDARRRADGRRPPAAEPPRRPAVARRASSRAGRSARALDSGASACGTARGRTAARSAARRSASSPDPSRPPRRCAAHGRWRSCWSATSWSPPRARASTSGSARAVGSRWSTSTSTI